MRAGRLNYEQAQAKPAEAPKAAPAVPTPVPKPVAKPRPAGDTIEMTRPQLAGILGVTRPQVRWAARALEIKTTPDQLTEWTPDQIRRLQVAAALAQSAGHGNWLAAVRAVFNTDISPEPPCWAILRDLTVVYALYRADVAGAVGDGGVVAKIDTLWTQEGP